MEEWIPSGLSSVRGEAGAASGAAALEAAASETAAEEAASEEAAAEAAAGAGDEELPEQAARDSTMAATSISERTK
jgi:hypothetical protein